MAHAAFELAQAHYSAEVGGLDSPSRAAIAEQTLPLAESVGLRDQPIARPVGDFAAKVGSKRKPS